MRVISLRDIVRDNRDKGSRPSESQEKRDKRIKQWETILKFSALGIAVTAGIDTHSSEKVIRALSDDAVFRNLIFNYLIAAEVNQMCAELPLESDNPGNFNPDSPWNPSNSGGV